MIENAKRDYLLDTAENLANLVIFSKTYWSLISTLLNKAKFPIMPPLYKNLLFIIDFEAKVQVFNDYFILKCSTTDTGSVIPPQVQGNSVLLVEFVISEEKISNITRSLNPNKAHGWDEISMRMIKLSDASLVTPLKIIFSNCLRQGMFPEI